MKKTEEKKIDELDLFRSKKKKSLNDKIKDNIKPLSITLILHLLILILFLSSKLSFKNLDKLNTLEIDIAEKTKEIEILKKKIEEKKKVLSDESINKLLKSMTVKSENRNKKTKKARQSVDDMIKEIKKEIKTKPKEKKIDKEYIKDSIRFFKSVQKNKEMLKKLKNKAENMGKSSVHYNLTGRNKITMPIPVYKCETGGTVVVDIIVNKMGDVLDCKINTNETLTTNRNLHKNALDAAYDSRFNYSESAPDRQNGKIVYIFIKQ